MTWRKWWALEIVTGFGIILIIQPLSFIRILGVINLVMLFSVAYLKRVLGQRAGR